MDIEEFLATSLQQIISGVKRAQEATKESGAKINGRATVAPSRDQKTGMPLQHVEFDLAVTATETKRSGGDVKVGIAMIGAGFGGGSAAENSTVSRIKFTVPLVLPYDPEDADSSDRRIHRGVIHPGIDEDRRF